MPSGVDLYDLYMTTSYAERRADVGPDVGPAYFLSRFTFTGWAYMLLLSLLDLHYFLSPCSAASLSFSRSSLPTAFSCESVSCSVNSLTAGGTHSGGGMGKWVGR